jgi:CO/xanthine dehydrogenase FAD-binding subunit
LTLFTPRNLDEALDALAAAPLTPIAGATDLFASWHQRPHDDLELLDLSRLAELRYARLDGDTLRLGALATYWDVIQSPEICAAFPLLPQAARLVGAIQIQSRGTWAGNIANGSPAADGVPVLMAYDATVVLACSRSLQPTHEISEVPLDRYFTGYKQSVRRPDQLITEIRLPIRARSAEVFHKVGARSAQAIAKVAVAIVRDALGWRIAASSVAPSVCRCRTLESALDAGSTFAGPDEVWDYLKSDVAPIDDIRSTARYRQVVLARLLHHALSQPGNT